MAKQHWVFNDEQLERALDAYCVEIGFPAGSEPAELCKRCTMDFLKSASAEKLRVRSFEPEPPRPPTIAAVAKVA